MTNQEHIFHPGEVLSEVYMRDQGLDAEKLAELCRCSISEIKSILRGDEGISVPLALTLGRIFDTDPKLWIKMQREYDQISKKPRSHPVF